MIFHNRRVAWVACFVAMVAVQALLAGSGMANEPAPKKATARYEVRFLTDMIDHHAMAVMMSGLCLDRAVHENLLELCHDIAQAQTQEIQQMQTWLEDWYGIDYEPEMSPGIRKEMERLAELEGAEFEIAFMEMMIRHHEAAVREGLHCAERAYHPELVRLCQNIVRTQTAEIELMQGWLCEWYFICD